MNLTFEQLYAPALATMEEHQARKVLADLVKATLARSAWEDTPYNRSRAEELIKEEIAFLARYESPSRAAVLHQLFIQTSKEALATP